MKAILLEQFGIDHLQLRVMPISSMGENEVLVKTTAVSLEFHGLIVIECSIQFGIPIPHILVYSVGNAQALNDLVNAIEKNNFKPVVDNVSPMEKVQEAFHRFKSGKAFGKVIVTF